MRSIIAAFLLFSSISEATQHCASTTPGVHATGAAPDTKSVSSSRKISDRSGYLRLPPPPSQSTRTLPAAPEAKATARSPQQCSLQPARAADTGRDAGQTPSRQLDSQQRLQHGGWETQPHR